MEGRAARAALRREGQDPGPGAGPDRQRFVEQLFGGRSLAVSPEGDGLVCEAGGEVTEAECRLHKTACYYS